ncbi:hypothetical protein Godav_010326 [Gossypium davidsonii]|uniref:Reverse transcriptase zinc-binding domain-containing protein n=2 Tax=Gossypium TaxID=3633 RepID=A0A7J8SHM4_GOSDV|nr:hypothetical protein [Gossypium davidsonii]MBA0671226.1 hypothetical protein [Gossypium klotzschianum]
MDTFTWKSEVLRALFDDEQVRRILAIPLASSAQKNEVVWHKDNTSVYIAKRGYKWLITEELDLLGYDYTTHSTVLKAFYTKLWNLNIPCKIKIAMWKIGGINRALVSGMFVHATNLAEDWCGVLNRKWKAKLGTLVGRRVYKQQALYVQNNSY